MRSSKSSSSRCPSEKFYINSNTLSVRGERVAVAVHQSRRAATRRHRIDIAETPSAFSVRGEDDNGRPKKAATVELKQCAPLVDDVLSRQVRKIRETVRTEDFERLLVALGGGAEARDGRKRPAINKDSYRQVYHKFFGRHYALLHEVVRKNKMSSIT